MTLRSPALATVLVAFLAGIVLSAAPVTAGAQAYDSDRDFERKALSDIRSVRRRIQKFREQLTGDAPAEPGRRAQGLYPGIVSRLEGLEKRCDDQEEYVRHMMPSSMNTDQRVYYERQTILNDIRNVQAEFGRIKRELNRLDEEAEQAERERAEREALEEEIMKEEW